MNHKLLAVVVAALAVVFDCAGARTVAGNEWARALGGVGSDILGFGGFGLPTADGGSLIAGETTSYGAGSWDAWLVKFDAAMTIQWQKAYGGAAVESCRAIAQTSDGGYILVLETNSVGAGDNDIWAMKLDAAGSISWQKTYGEAGADNPRAVLQTSDGGYMICGTTTSFGTARAFLMRLDATGGVGWWKTYENGGNVYACDGMTASPDVGYLIGGMTDENAPGVWGDAWLMKVDSSGAILFQKSYRTTSSPESAGEALYRLVATTDGGFISAGWRSDGQRDAWVTKVNAAGDLSWNMSYGGPADDNIQDIVQTGDGGYAIAGNPYSGIGPGWLIRLNPTGGVIWQKTYGGTNNASAEALIEAAGGGFRIFGSVSGFGFGSSDGLVALVSSTGNIDQSCGTFVSDGSATSQAWSTTVTNTNAAVVSRTPVVTGTSAVSATTSASTATICQSPATCALTCSATVPSSTQVGSTVSFTSSATATGSGCSGAISYNWDFGDASTANAPSTTHVYLSAGTYQWTLRTSISGATDCAQSGTIAVTGGASCTIGCSASAPASAQPGVSVQFTAAATPSPGCTNPVTYGWTFGDGSVSADQNPMHSYLAEGTYTWNLTTTGDGGATCQQGGTIPVASAGSCVVTPRATVPESGSVGQSIRFAGSATRSGSCGSGAINYKWRFGDGKSSTDAKPIHSYRRAGSYQWSFTATSGNTKATLTGSILIAAGSDCSLTVTSSVPSSGRVGTSVQFSVSTKTAGCDDRPTYKWTFGDGKRESAQNPKHSYSSPGQYAWSVTVRVRNIPVVVRTGVITIDPR